MTTLLRVDQLEVRYGQLAAVRGISFHVDVGEFVGVIGPNGAGKSTTLAAIAGLLRPAAGSIEFDGESIAGSQPDAIVRRGIALVPEGRHIFGSLTTEENLLIGASIRKDRAGIASDIERALTIFPRLRDYLKTSAGRLSGGEQQQLAIARALLARPKLLMLDEPSLGLAPIIVDRVFDTVAELRREGVTVLLVEQNARVAVELADRTYVLRQGTIARAGSRAELARDEGFQEAYLGF